MNPIRTWRILAFINIGVGALFVFGALSGFVAMFFQSKDDPRWLAAVTMTGLLGAIGVCLIQPGASHLRQPGIKSALTLASNSSVLVWFIASGLIGAIRGRHYYGQYLFIIALMVAWLSHRFFLKPSALRAFPEITGNPCDHPPTAAL